MWGLGAGGGPRAVILDAVVHGQFHGGSSCDRRGGSVGRVGGGGVGGDGCADLGLEEHHVVVHPSLVQLHEHG